jgi:cytochrome b561
MSAPAARFPLLSRLLHWLMAAMILFMLFIGVMMAATETESYARLVALHRPLGIAILVLAVLRLVNRLVDRPPPLPESLPPLQRFAARATHVTLYALMILMPLVGWSMLSAAGYPIVLAGSLQLPPILPRDLSVYATLREAHRVLAYLFYATFLLHMAAALLHGLIRRDGVFESMTSLRLGRGR